MVDRSLIRNVIHRVGNAKGSGGHHQAHVRGESDVGRTAWCAGHVAYYDIWAENDYGHGLWLTLRVVQCSELAAAVGGALGSGRIAVHCAAVPIG